MSDSKQLLDPSSALSFIHNHPISFSQPHHNLLDSHLETNFSNSNDSNSDDTQFDVQNTQLTSNHTTPVKDKPSLTQLAHPTTSPHLSNNFSPNHPLSSDQLFVPDNNLQSPKQTSLNNPHHNPDHSDFVDYFLAQDDFLQALDDYTRSVGQTSAFPFENSPPFSSQLSNTPTPPFNPTSNHQTESFRTNLTVPKRAPLVSADPTAKRSSRSTNTHKKNLHQKTQRASNHDDVKQPTPSSAPRRSEKRKPRTYSQAIPSQHCHICSRRPTETSPHAVCGNLLKGRCRKTICTKCFHQFRWDLKAAREAPPGTWECPHCRGECPQRAQCVIYNRTSDRRRMKLINHRKKKDQTKGSNSRKTDLNRKSKEKTESRSESPNSGTTAVNTFVSNKSRSSNRNDVAQRTSVKSEKKGAEMKGISKATRVSGLSEHGQLALMAEGIHETALSDWSEKGKRDISVLENPLQKTQIGLGQNVEGNATPKEKLVKSEIGALGQNGLEGEGRNVCEDVVGVFGYMNVPNDILEVECEDQNDKGMRGVAEGENEGLEPSLNLLDIDESFESRGDVECGQVRLRMWDEDESKYEQAETGDFPFQENVLDLDTFN